MGKIINAFKQKDTRKKILFTLAILLIYRIGAYLPLPGIPFHAFADAFENSSQAAGIAVLNLFSGGALSHMSLFALGIMPYITASIIMQLMGVVIPRVGEWKKQGAEGRRNITKWTRYLTFVIGLINAVGYLFLFKSAQYGITFNDAMPGVLNDVMVVFAMMAGVIIIMWLGELITQHGLGNGMSIIIFANVISSIPPALVSSATTSGTTTEGIALTVGIILAIVVLVPCIVFIERAARRVPLYSTKAGGDSAYARSHQTNYLPIKLDQNGVIGIIFASCLIYIPTQISAFLPNVEWLKTLSNALASGPVNWGCFFVLIILFCIFYTSISFDTDEIAKNLQRQGSYIPGVRPGTPTSNFLHDISSRLLPIGSGLIAILAVGSSIAFFFTNNTLLQAFGGTSILIMVSVAMQFMAQVEQSVKATDPAAVLRRLG